MPASRALHAEQTIKVMATFCILSVWPSVAGQGLAGCRGWTLLAGRRLHDAVLATASGKLRSTRNQRHVLECCWKGFELLQLHLSLCHRVVHGLRHSNIFAYVNDAHYISMVLQVKWTRDRAGRHAGSAWQPWLTTWELQDEEVPRRAVQGLISRLVTLQSQGLENKSL